MTPAADILLAVARRLRHVARDRIHPAVGAVTAGHHLHHLVPVETSRDADAISVARHHHHLVPVVTSCAADATTVARHRHLVPVVMSRAADATTIVARRHLAPAGTTIDAMTAAAAMGEIAMSLLCGIVGAASRFRGRRRLVCATSVSVSVRRHGRAPGIVIVITIAEEMIHGTGTGIAGADDAKACSGW
jgi:hypothetical protein